MSTLRGGICCFAIALAGVVGCVSAPAPPAAPAAPTAPPPPQTTDGTIVNVDTAQPCCDKQTLPEYLGCTQCWQRVGRCVLAVRSYLGQFYTPFAEAAVGDAANLQSDVPGVATAAEIKAEEDAAQGKILALRYLASIGCGGCYPGVEQALLDGLDDCTEEVRFEAAKAFRAAAGNPCKLCNSSSCCSPKVRAKLQQMAYESGDDGCPFEASARVRRMARSALRQCGPYCNVGQIDEPDELPEEGPADVDAQPEEALAGGERRPYDLAGAAPSATDRGTTPDDSPQNVLVTSFDLLGAEQPELVATVVAEVNDEPIYAQEVFAAARQLHSDRSQKAQDDGYLGRQMWKAVDLVIERKLICQHARSEAIEGQLDNWARDEQRAIRLAQHVPGGAARPVEPSEEYLVRRWLELLLRLDEPVNWSEVVRKYQENIARYQATDEVRWEQIVATAGDNVLSEEARATIEYLRDKTNGESVKVSRKVKLQAVATNSYGWTCPSSIENRDIQVALARLPVGSVSDVLTDEGSYCIVRVLERRSVNQTTIEEAAVGICQEILDERRRARKSDYVAWLRGRATICVHWGALIDSETAADLSDGK